MFYCNTQRAKNDHFIVIVEQRYGDGCIAEKSLHAVYIITELRIVISLQYIITGVVKLLQNVDNSFVEGGGS